MKAPAFPLYVQDLLVGGALMSNEEFGMYMRLLCYQWAHGAIPSEAKRLQQLLNSRKSIPGIILEKFKLGEDGKYRNERMELEREKQAVFKLRQALNGASGGRPKKTQKEPKENPGLYSGETQTITQKKPFSFQSSYSLREREPAWKNSAEEAVVFCAGAGIPEEFIRRVWHQHDGTTWLDSQGRPVTNFRSYLTGRFTTERSYRLEKVVKPIAPATIKSFTGPAQYEPKEAA